MAFLIEAFFVRCLLRYQNISFNSQSVGCTTIYCGSSMDRKNPNPFKSCYEIWTFPI